VTQASKLAVVSIPQQGTRLKKPFSMLDLVQIDDLMLGIFLCQGTLQTHRHVDQDELFLVHTGTINVESDWGDVLLRPHELAVVPKGVGHRSASLIPSLVLLLQPRVVVDRRNGDRRLFALKGEKHLEKVSLAAMGHQVVVPFSPVLVANLDTFAFQLTLCEGAGPWQTEERQASLIWCHDGRLTVDTERLGHVSLGPAELTVIPSRTTFRLLSTGRATVLGVRRHKQPGLPLPGRE
jgi:mannose-6-phosphate isomerase-like protein (cupin superfamily)